MGESQRWACSGDCEPWFAGRAFYEKGDMQTAGYFLNIFTSFIDDENANKMMEDVKAKIKA